MSESEKKNSEEVLCPSCGRFVGAYEICPNCQTQINTRVSIKLVKRISVIGAIIGVLLLFFAAKNREVPTINIGEIDINHNMALVKLSGRVVKESFMKEKDSFKIIIDDGTGRITLGGFNKLRKWKKHFGKKFPKEGDFIEVTGNLSISEQFGASMFLSSPYRLVVKKAFKPKKVLISDLSLNDINKVFKLDVEISLVKKFKFGYSVKVKDSSGNINITIFNSIYDRIKDNKIKNALVTVGSKLSIVAILSEYKGTLQLKLKNPNNPDYINIISYSENKTNKSEQKKETIPTTVISSETSKIKTVKVSEITNKLLDNIVEVKGTIENFIPNKWGTKIILSDDTGSVDIWIKKYIYDKVEIKFIKGMNLIINGNVSTYKGKLQVIPNKKSDIKEVN